MPNLSFESISVPPPLKHRCPAEIVRARVEDRLVVFAGSGASVPTERPDWQGLIGAILKLCSADELNNPRLRAARDLFKLSEDTAYRKLIPTIVKNIIGESKFYARLGQSLEPEAATRASRTHNLLLNLSPKAIVTTNYDQCFEICAYESRAPWSPLVVETLHSHDAGDFVANGIVYHVHGFVRDPATMVVGLGDYTRLYRRATPALAFLREVFENYTVLFVGCSLRDEEILGELADSIWKHAHYAIAEMETEAAAVFESLGVNVVPFHTVTRQNYSPSYKEVEDILSDWVRDLNAHIAGGERRAY